MRTRAAALVVAINRMPEGKALAAPQRLLALIDNTRVRETGQERPFTKHSVATAVRRAIELELLDEREGSDGKTRWLVRSAAVFTDADLLAAVQEPDSANRARVALDRDVALSVAAQVRDVWDTEGAFVSPKSLGNARAAGRAALLAAIYDRTTFVWSELDYARLLKSARGELGDDGPNARRAEVSADGDDAFKARNAD